jgi:hypothetical protein
LVQIAVAGWMNQPQQQTAVRVNKNETHGVKV